MLHLILYLLAFLFLSVTNQNEAQILYEMDLSEGLQGFQSLQQNTAKVITDPVTSESIISFDGLTRYGGTIAKDWIASDNDWYTITFMFKGVKDQRTGFLLGYIRKDNESLIHTIAMDEDYLQEKYQPLILNNSGEWNEYKTKIKVSSEIKIIMEKGYYYGYSGDLDAYIKDLEINVGIITDECPGSNPEATQEELKAFFDLDSFAGKISQKLVIDDAETATLDINFPVIEDHCLKTQFYGIDNDSNVIEAMQQTVTDENDEDYIKRTYNYQFTSEQLQNFNCTKCEAECTRDGVETICFRYECNYQIHFYLDYKIEYSTKQEEFEYSKANAASIFSSTFIALIYQDTKKFFNVYIFVPNKDQPCVDRCQVKKDVECDIYVKNAKGQWLDQSTLLTVVWGDLVDFKITCTPTNYILEFFDIYLVLTYGQISLGYDFITNFDNSIHGQMLFTMPMSSEAGLKQGDPFNFLFHILIEEVTTRRRRQLTTTFKSDSLPTTALTPLSPSSIDFGDCTTKSSCISSSCSSSDICTCNDESSCKILEQCGASNCTCGEITDMKTRCELMECIENYGCGRCFCIPPNAVVNVDGTIKEWGDSESNETESESESSDSSDSSESGKESENNFGGRIAIWVIALLAGVLVL